MGSTDLHAIIEPGVWYPSDGEAHHRDFVKSIISTPTTRRLLRLENMACCWLATWHVVEQPLAGHDGVQRWLRPGPHSWHPASCRVERGSLDITIIPIKEDYLAWLLDVQRPVRKSEDSDVGRRPVAGGYGAFDYHRV